MYIIKNAPTVHLGLFVIMRQQTDILFAHLRAATAH